LTRYWVTVSPLELAQHGLGRVRRDVRASRHRRQWSRIRQREREVAASSVFDACGTGPWIDRPQ
jgi:hypothetical protein